MLALLSVVNIRVFLKFCWLTKIESVKLHRVLPESEVGGFEVEYLSGLRLKDQKAQRNK